MRFLLDAQLPPKLAAALRRSGHDAEHVFEHGLLAVPDIEIWRRAGELGATILTKDSDFVAIRLNAIAGPAVVWIRLGNVTNESLERALMRHLSEIVSAIETGETLIELA